MKKAIFLMAVALLAMTSCTKEETLERNAGRSIDFRAAMGTRADETKTDNLTSFYVTALLSENAGENNYFTDANFTGSAGGSFTSTPLYYWPNNNAELTFYAYSPSTTDLGGTLTINSAKKELADFTPNVSIASQKDFITATKTGTKNANEESGVQLTFTHELAQIGVKAKNSNTTLTYEIVGVRIGKVVSKGTFTFPTTAELHGAWSLASDKVNYDVTLANAITLTAEAQDLLVNDGKNAMLIPQQLTAWDLESGDKQNNSNGSYLAVKLKVTNTADNTVLVPAAGTIEGSTHVWAAVPIDENWEAGKKYIYTLDFSAGAGNGAPDGEPEYKPGEPLLGKPITFTVTVSEWTPVANDVTM